MGEGGNMKFNLTRLHHTMEARNLSRLGTLVCLLSLLFVSPASLAGSIKCWVNKDGVRECGYTVPPEYSQQRIEIMNQRGIVVEVKDVCFAKKRGLAETEMCRSEHVYHRLRRFRAGIESGISWLKRCMGFARCTWKGFRSFRSYVWSSIVAANLLTIARAKLAT